MKELSVVIVGWNTRHLLVQCLHSLAMNLADFGPDSVETIVVDNASTDGSVAMVRQQFSWVKLIESHKNLGFAGANNRAIRSSVGRYVLLLNPDTEMRPGALISLVRFLERNPAAGVACARLLNVDGTLQTSCYPAPTLSRELWRLFHMDALYPYGVYRMADWPVDEPRETDVAMGACMLLRREVFNQVGLLDESYFMYSEEVDLCFRIRNKGWQIFWVPQAQVVHYGGQSTRQAAGEMFLHLYQGKLSYFRKHHGWWAARLYKVILLAATLARLMLTPLAWLERPKRRQQHLALASNYQRLLTKLPTM